MKKNFIKIFLLIFLISNLTFSENKKLNENFGIEDGEVYYINRKIEGADAKTFEVFEDNEYAKDKKNVYYGDKVLNEADPKSFKLLTKISYGLGKDKNNLYFWENKVNNIDVKTLKIMTDEFSIYLKDKNGVYILFSYNGGLPVDLDNGIISPKILKNVDKQTFQLISGGYSKDKNSVYYIGKKIDGADPKNFKVLKDYIFTDEKNVYLYGEKKEEIDLQTLKFFDNDSSYFFDKNNIYFQGDKLENADFKSFKTMELNFSKDKNNVYLGNEKIEGADAKTFEVIDIYAGFERDKNYLYYSNERIKNSDPYTFQRINEHLVRDKNQFYSKGKVLDVDGKTFQIVKDYEKDYFMYAKDKNKVYYINFMDGKDEMVKELKGLNPKNFKVLNRYYTKDDKKVYFSKEYADIQEVQDVDVKSFEALHFENIENKDDFGKDKNKVYLFGLELKGVKPEKFQVMKEPITEKIIYVRDENNLFVIFYDYFSGFNFVKTKKFENIDFETLKWKSARELEDKNGKYIVNGSVIDEDKIEIKFIKK